MKNFNLNWDYDKTITVITIVLGFIILSFIFNSIKTPQGEEVILESQNPKKNYRIIKIDGCEYIEIGWISNPSYDLIHKGNCSNPSHCN